MAFATFKVENGDKSITINLKARYTQKGSIVVATGRGDVVEFTPDGGIDIISTPFMQYVLSSK